MKNNITEGAICGFCKIGRLISGEGTFTFEKTGQSMMVEHTPAITCGACDHAYFTESISKQLVEKTLVTFAKSHCFIFAYQFSDLIRPTSFEFKTFDRVRIKYGVDTWDMYDENLEPGMEGTVIDKGMNPFDWLVEFRIGKRKNEIIQVEIDESDLDFLHHAGDPTIKSEKTPRK